jgi:hypothetical protein
MQLIMAVRCAVGGGRYGGMKRAATAGVAVLAVGLSLAGCGGSNGDARAGEAVEPSIPVTTASQGIVATASLDGFGECAGTGKLAKTTMSGTNVLGITWTTTTALPTGDSSYYLMAGPYQIGLRSLPGNQVARFVFDTRTGKQENLTSSYILDGATGQLIVPFASLQDLAAWPETWTATVSTGGADAGTCTGT